MPTGVSIKVELWAEDSEEIQAGFAYIYISNENPTLVDVYFDDLKIAHTKTPVL